MDKITIAFDIAPTSRVCPFRVEVWLDHLELLLVDRVTDSVHFKHELDNSGEHELRIVLQGKLPEHTKIDEQGNIISDATLFFSNVIIDGFPEDIFFQKMSVYTHNFNGTQPEIADSFHGIAGCNGVISFRFSTPFFPWMLENM